MRKGLVIKKILLTLGALPASFLIGYIWASIAALITGLSFASTGPGHNLARVGGVIFFVSFITLTYLIWRDMWKLFFCIYLFLTISGLFIIFPYLSGLGILNVIYALELVLALVGVYAYSFKRKLFSVAVWKVIFIFCLIEDIFAQITNFLPQIHTFIPSYLFGSSDLIHLRLRYGTVDNHIGNLLLLIFSLLALYRLAFKSQK